MLYRRKASRVVAKSEDRSGSEMLGGWTRDWSGGGGGWRVQGATLDFVEMWMAGNDLVAAEGRRAATRGHGPMTARMLRKSAHLVSTLMSH